MTSVKPFTATQSTYNLFLREFQRSQQIDSLLMAKLDIVSQKKYEYQFANIFLLLVSVKLVSYRIKK